jgi:hypothetical protein
MQFKLGTGIGKTFPFERVPLEPPQKPTKKKDDSIVTKKIVVVFGIFGILAIVKIAVLILWI